MHEKTLSAGSSDLEKSGRKAHVYDFRGATRLAFRVNGKPLSPHFTMRSGCNAPTRPHLLPRHTNTEGSARQLREVLPPQFRTALPTTGGSL